ncbi:DNA-processing protein DprA [Roseivivax sp. GX 12232]|uniref:DNA-processing protein DprA n=1 Tax=Roseivivax sp. GX 12232 TaxID=2900547 RepID=UPI001E5222A3|nr:DNA-processing protein DprA [Roseivivax sp. GX 12232]MCE0504404.1 DNA-processing protein DprA [Roseivivax sp. GX 12232]
MAEDFPSSTHPLLPPPTEDARFDWLRLLRCRRVGISTFYRLLGEFCTPGAALEALPEIAAEAGVGGYRICPEAVVAAELRAGRAAGARLICRGDADYPARLTDLEDAPPLIWVMGDPALFARPMVALIGARNASSLGRRMARRLATDLGDAGQVVVSGLARGIDAEAHRAALSTGTLAVMGGGVDVLYPQENAGLAAEIVAGGGCRISEQPMGMTPQARHFPARNRLIAGLSRAVIAVEAAARSGSLITARAALDLGREVMAVPGHPFDARAAGCNMLIRDGAALVRGAGDVLEALDPEEVIDQDDPQAPLPLGPGVAREAGPGRAAVSRAGQGARDDMAEAGTPKAPAPANTAKPPVLPDTTLALHQEILSRLGPSPIAEDQLMRDLARPARDIAPLLTDLELEGRIRRAAGGMVARLPD